MRQLDSLPVPEFAFVVPDGARLKGHGLMAGDIILCDSNTAGADFVVARYGGENHVCIQTAPGALLDVVTGQPEDAEPAARIIGVVRLWTQQPQCGRSGTLAGEVKT